MAFSRPPLQGLCEDGVLQPEATVGCTKGSGPPGPAAVKTPPSSMTADRGGPHGLPPQRPGMAGHPHVAFASCLVPLSQSSHMSDSGRAAQPAGGLLANWCHCPLGPRLTCAFPLPRVPQNRLWRRVTPRPPNTPTGLRVARAASHQATAGLTRGPCLQAAPQLQGLETGPTAR